MQTVLHVAAANNSLGVVQQMVSRGLDIDVADLRDLR